MLVMAYIKEKKDKKMGTILQDMIGNAFKKESSNTKNR